MSGQWPVAEKPEEGTSCFPRIFREACDREALRDLVRQLLPDEVKIASVYLENLLKTRPIKQAAIEESRAHMAVLELENDPR